MGGISLYISALIMGLAGSLYCLGMCGPIYMATSGFYEKPSDYLKPLLLHHLGKTMSYAALGVVMGLLGKGASLLMYQNNIMILCGAVLLFIAVFGVIKLPILKGVNTRITALMGKYLKKSSNTAVLLGLVNGFIPCGLVYAAAVGAAATQSLVGGMTFMVIFGLGTLPALTLIAFAKWFIPMRRIKNLAVWKQVPMFILGFWMLFKGLGLGIPYVSPDLNSHSPEKNCCRPHHTQHSKSATQ
jgi:sulfite exporter TauE/SafE